MTKVKLNNLLKKGAIVKLVNNQRGAIFSFKHVDGILYMKNEKNENYEDTPWSNYEDGDDGKGQIDNKDDEIVSIDYTSIVIQDINKLLK